MLYLERGISLLKKTWPDQLKESVDKILSRTNLSPKDKQHFYNLSHGTNHLEHLFRYSNN
jgi:hypothetical protein